MKLILLLFSLISINAMAGVTVKSCTGDIRYCDEFGICTDDYYYLYAFQVATIEDGQIKKARFRFRMRGALGDAQDYQMSSELIDDKIVYLGLNFDLAIPLESQSSVLYRSKDAEWLELCP